MAEDSVPENVSMKDIAIRASCSVSTVSRALRGDERISPEARERVARAAEALGYRWNRQASRMMANFRAKATGRSAARETIALVHAKPRCYEREDPLGFWTALTGAAVELGLRVDEFALDPRPGDLGKSGRRANRILKARGIRGLVLFPFYEPDISAWELDWASFALVAVGSSPDQPNIDRVDLSDYEDTMMCLREIASRGYRRIGLTSSEDSERHTNGVFVAAYRYFCETQPNVEGCPVLRLTGRNRERMTPGDRAGFEQWFREHRPDAILTSHHDVREWLAGMDLHAPDDIGLATVWPHEGWAGIEFESRRLMRPALEHLCAKLWTNDFGLSEISRRLLVRSPWREGSTLRRATKRGRGLD